MDWRRVKALYVQHSPSPSFHSILASLPRQLFSQEHSPYKYLTLRQITKSDTGDPKHHNYYYITWNNNPWVFTYDGMKKTLDKLPFNVSTVDLFSLPCLSIHSFLLLWGQKSMGIHIWWDELPFNVSTVDLFSLPCLSIHSFLLLWGQSQVIRDLKVKCIAIQLFNMQ